MHIFMATWPSGLRRLIRNQMGNTRVGSNPAVVDPYTLGYMYFYKKKIFLYNKSIVDSWGTYRSAI